MDNEHVQIYREITGFTPSLFQQDLIAVRVTDTDRWRKAVIWWMSNDYRPQSVGKVLDYYDQMLTEQSTFGTPRKAPNTHVGAHTVSQPASVEPDPPCEFCGKDVCWSLHVEERRAVERQGVIQ